jgi:hypothetical protein
MVRLAAKGREAELVDALSYRKKHDEAAYHAAQTMLGAMWGRVEKLSRVFGVNMRDLSPVEPLGADPVGRLAAQVPGFAAAMANLTDRRAAPQ